MTTCYCGSALPYAECCQPLHQGEPAATPETLMRSRFSAFVLGDVDYLLASWHPQTRPTELSLDNSPDWTQLEVLSSSEQKSMGTVDFRAIYRLANGWGALEEQSRFERINGRWYYLDGISSEGAFKPGRNQPCPCGSGRKYKACCLA